MLAKVVVRDLECHQCDWLGGIGGGGWAIKARTLELHQVSYVLLTFSCRISRPIVE